MDTKILEKANEINKDIQRLENFIGRMDVKDGVYYPFDFDLKYLPQNLKDLLRPILKAYQEKLFNELKNL